MNKEELIKNQFPNDEFLQSAVLRIVDKCTADLEIQLAKAKEGLEWFVWYYREGCPKSVQYKDYNVGLVEQFLNELKNTDTSSTKNLTERQRLQIESLEGQTPWKDIKDKSEVIGKLTQAKEIIKNLIDDLTTIDGEEVKELGTVKEAEQFIKD
jgi:hypothetical protein